MAQDQKQEQEEVLIARNKKTGKVGAVTGLKKDGSPDTADVKKAKLSDLLIFNKGQNPVEAFVSNFVKQYENPTLFEFFRLPADRFDSIGVAMADLAKDPEAYAEMLKKYKVDPPKVKKTQEQKQDQTQETPPVPEAGQEPVQKKKENEKENVPSPETGQEPLQNKKENVPSPESDVPQQETAVSEAKEADQSATAAPDRKTIDPDKVDWDGLKEKWGIDRDELKKSGDLREMIYNRKSKLVTVTPTFGGEKFAIDARLSFLTDSNGNVKVVPHFIHREPNLDQEFNGYKFSKEEKTALRKTGNLGKVVELTGKNGDKVPSYVSIDRYTNEIVSVPVKDVRVRDTVGQTKLTEAEVAQLKQGMALPPKEITDKNGKTYTVVLQVSAERKDLEFVPGAARKQEQSQWQTQTQSGTTNQQQSSWLTKDGRIKPLSKWAKIPLTEQQQKDYAEGSVAELTNRLDDKGQPCTVYLWFNPEKQRPNTSLNDPRVKVAEESRTQKAVNNDGLTNEATKHVAEPLLKYQTAPKNAAQQQQQKQQQQKRPGRPRL